MGTCPQLPLRALCLGLEVDDDIVILSTCKLTRLLGRGDDCHIGRFS